MPMMNLLVVALVLGLGYYWAGQGLLSSLIHFLCVLVAGAVAFAVWEPLTYGVLMGVREDISWTLGLMTPFLVTLALLRVLTNKLIPMNMDFSDGVNFVGGAVFGGLSGVLTAGVLVISIGFLPLPPNFMGYQPVGWDNATGEVDARSGSNLWLPADKITALVYDRLSVGTLSTATPLADRMPSLNEQTGLLRTTYESQSRTTLSPQDVTLVGRYTVTAKNPVALVSDSFVISSDGAPVPQTVTLPDGSPPPAGSRIEGFSVKFGPGAKEKQGQVVVGPGQIRLLVTTPKGGMSLGPIAFITRASGSTLQVNRYRFDSPKVYAASVGGAAEATIAFEFVVPPDATATDLLVKNIRLPLASGPAPREIASIGERDELIRSGEIIGVHAEAKSAPTVVTTGDQGPSTISSKGDAPNGRPNEIRATGYIGFTFNKQNRGGLELNSDNRIINGKATFDRNRMGSVSVPGTLRVEQIQQTPGVVIVQVDMSPQSRVSLLGQSMDAAERVLPPTLTDTLGQRYEAVGYIYEDQSKYEIRFTPGAPIRGMSEVPRLSRSRSDQKLRLLFTPSANVKIKTFGLGSVVKIILDPPLQLRGR